MRKTFSGFRVVNVNDDYKVTNGDDGDDGDNDYKVTNGDNGDDGDDGDNGDKYDFLFSISGSAKGIIVIHAFSLLVLRLYF